MPKPRRESPPRGDWSTHPPAAGQDFRACPAAYLPQIARGLSYALAMSQPSSNSSSAGSLGRTIVAILVLLVVGYFLLHVIIGIAVAVAGFALVVLAVVAVIWALRILL